jgi:hypothetical protein
MLILVKAFAAALAVNMDSSFDCNSLSLEGESLTIISAINSAASSSDWNFSSIIGEYTSATRLLLHLDCYKVLASWVVNKRIFGLYSVKSD